MYSGVVVNPCARKNRGAPDDWVDRLRQLVGDWGEVHETGSLEQLPAVVGRLRSRASHLVSEGGDGALHWLINEFLAQEPDPPRWPTFVPANGGSIDFVARKARVRGRAEAILAALVAAARADCPPLEFELDTLQLHGETTCGTTFHRIGFALAAGGVGNRFFDEYDRYPRSGRLTMARVIARAIAPCRTKFAMAAPRPANRA